MSHAVSLLKTCTEGTTAA